VNRALISTRMTSWLMTKGILPKSTKCPAKVSVLIATLRKEFPQQMEAAERHARNDFGVIGGSARFSIVEKMCGYLEIDMRTGDQKAQEKRKAYERDSRKPTYEATAAFLESYEWRRVRMQALKSYGARCQCCGVTPADGARMNVDHIKPRKLFPELALDVSNLQVLCHDCNHGKGNWDMTDWRVPLKTEWTVREPDEAWAAHEIERCKPDWAAAGLDALVKAVQWDTKNGYCYIVEWRMDKPTTEHWSKVREVFGKNITQFDIDGIIYHGAGDWYDALTDYSVEEK